MERESGQDCERFLASTQKGLGLDFLSMLRTVLHIDTLKQLKNTKNRLTSNRVSTLLQFFPP